ncbi:predicted protein [Postia placenta Mad-698-R]|nr:predicted protein [Postia placenta Mad-698-R]
MASLTPPQLALRWSHSADDILSLTKQAITKHGEGLDKIAALPKKDCNFDSSISVVSAAPALTNFAISQVFLALAEADTELSLVTEPLSFYQNVSTSKELRDASNAAEVLVRDYDVEASMRLDVFEVMVAAEENIKQSSAALGSEEQRLMERSLLDGKRAGLALPEKERGELTMLKKELSQASLEFSKNFNEENMFAVWENGATDESGFVGYCYLDLFPRESKYSHAAVWPLLQGFTRSDGTRHYPLAAMVANLAKPTPTTPALMQHQDVVTFFHEMGHVFHGLLQCVSGELTVVRVARDFVEAPSQMLENWCFEPAVLERMSSHYETKKPLSRELADKINKSRHVNVGMFYLRQVFFAKFDIKVHTEREQTDYTALWNDLRKSITQVNPGRRAAGQGSFGHIAGGYDAGYYGYMYSLVFAADMYATVFKADPLDPARGARYSKSILQPGGSRDESLSLEEFLGRPPNADAFVREIFGETGSANL